MPKSQVVLTTFNTFGELLKFLRRRARLTQRDLSIAVGYSEAQISRLETNQRSPEMAALKALFVPALGIEDEPEVIARLTELAVDSHIPFNGEHARVEESQEVERDFSAAATEALLSASLKRTHNLPLQLTSFIGREREIGMVRSLLEGSRLVTLHGSGGTGKTRLCLEVAGQVRELYPDGAWLVELAPLTDLDKIPQLINATLGLIDSRSRSALDLLVDFLGDKCILLLLDNCEHLIDACARLADRLLQACPQLTILATSREALGVTGEATYRVPSLSIPQAQYSHEEITRFESVRLFVERAASIQPGFLVTEANAQAVVQICRRLDGIPLAIELAAGRVDLLSPEQIAARLDHRFRLLTGGSRTALPRQQTLRASIDWSYSLLTESERLLLQRLSVFSGGWTLEAAEEVCGFDGLDDFEVLDGLGQLVKKSLVVVDSQAAVAVRYHMLETLRQYLVEKRVEAGEEDEIRQQHMIFFMQLSETAEQELKGPQQHHWLTMLGQEYDNLRVALSWAIEHQCDIEGLRMAGALHLFWHMRGDLSEGIRWLLAVIKQGENKEEIRHSLWLAKALYGVGFLYADQHNPIDFHPPLEKALAIYRQHNDHQGIGDTLWGLAVGLIAKDNQAAEQMVNESLIQYQLINDKRGIAWSLMGLGYLRHFQGKRQLARPLIEESALLLQEVGDLWRRLSILYPLADFSWDDGETTRARGLLKEYHETVQTLGYRFDHGILDSISEMAAAQGDYVEAVATRQQDYELSREAGLGSWTNYSQAMLGMLAYYQGNLTQAHAYLDQSIRKSQEIDTGQSKWMKCVLANVYLKEQNIERAESLVEEYETFIKETRFLNKDAAYITLSRGNIYLAKGEFLQAQIAFQHSLADIWEQKIKPEIPERLEGLAKTAVMQGHCERAARLLGAASNLRSQFATPLHPVDRPDYDKYLTSVQAKMSDRAFKSSWEEGRAMKLEQAVEYALAYKGD